MKIHFHAFPTSTGMFMNLIDRHLQLEEVLFGDWVGNSSQDSCFVADFDTDDETDDLESGQENTAVGIFERRIQLRTKGLSAVDQLEDTTERREWISWIGPLEQG